MNEQSWCAVPQQVAATTWGTLPRMSYRTKHPCCLAKIQFERSYTESRLMGAKMPYRPEAVHRRNAQGVLLPLTAAIHRVFGHRAQDLGRPIGAFYTVNVSSIVWQHFGGGGDLVQGIG